VTAFAVAMGFLEAVVVVYLREIYYPDGFSFPLEIIQPRIFKIEIVREVTTLVMLLTVGLLIGKTRNGKFAGFLLTFGIWDIFYYIGLKVFLDWPESLLTWDILFLIPVTWIGPVLAPVICSLTMIYLGIHILLQERTYGKVILGKMNWILLISGAVLIFTSFIQDYTLLMYENGIFSGTISLEDQNFIDVATAFVPEKFNWFLFLAGEFLIVLSIVFLHRKSYR
jgi:hypothetical protein